MLVKLHGILDKYPDTSIEVNVTSMKEVLSYLDFSLGKEFMETLGNNPFYYILSDSSETLPSLAVSPDLLGMDFMSYDTLDIIPDISGDVPAAAVGAVLGTGAIASFAIATVINIGISIALNMLMSALSPTPEFSSDPAYSQNKSNLFNGAPVLREQGGSVPLVFGNPYCGGVLISSGVFSEEI